MWERHWCKFRISWLYLGMPFFQLGVFLSNVEYGNAYFCIGRPVPFKYIVYGPWFLWSWITICCLYFCRLSSSILKVSYLLHEHPVPLLVSTNHPQMKCEKTEANNLFVSILDGMYHTVFNRSRKYYCWRFKGYFQSVCNIFFVFFYVYYIFTSEYLKMHEVIFFY